MKYRDIIRLLEDDGWEWERSKGSHRIYKHPTKAGSIVVAVHNMGRDVPTGTAKSILKQAGLQ